MLKSFLTITFFGLVSQSAFGANYACKITRSGTQVQTGTVNTADANSYIAYSDSSSGLVAICAALADSSNQVLNAIACGVMTANGVSVNPALRFVDGKVTAANATSWENLGYTSDVAPFTGSSFQYRGDSGTIALSTSCERR